MILEQNITDDDKKKLENMLSLQYAMPYEAFHNRKLAYKLVYIMTPILFLSSIGCFYLKSYVMFGIGIVVAIISTIWII
ncbi:hypothetical protein NSB04_19840 [Blautia pseudococcoides]|nr:hypothetical protein [Blautia pseudococcoides]